MAPKKNWINDLDLIGSIVMIAFLFFGTFYKGDGGFYSVKYNVTGYKMLFNTDFIMGTLLLLCPAITLITNYVTAMKKSEKLIKLVMPILALILVFVLKSQLSSELDYSGGSMGLGFSGIVYLIAGLVSLIAAVARFLNQDLSQKIKGKK
ncbi:hypothetical protein [Lapidilactobacillus luobeiensis]|uniref:hypothetical protein n=1 Tax=Lapidilactobacillus luobeiensis TaxID=2950371 RepID=UPI0021C2F4EC|nr:hypothetical protein [Lapidilactobacillus luobeiensis]